MTDAVKRALKLLGLRNHRLTNILGEPILGSAHWPVLHSWEEINNIRNEEDALIVRKIGIGGALQLLLKKLEKLKDLESYNPTTQIPSSQIFSSSSITWPKEAKAVKKEADQILFIIVYKSDLSDKRTEYHIKFRKKIMENFALIGEFASNNLYSNAGTMVDYTNPFYNLDNKIRNVKGLIEDYQTYQTHRDRQSMKIALAAIDPERPKWKHRFGIPGAKSAWERQVRKYLGGKRRKTRRKTRRRKTKKRRHKTHRKKKKLKKRH